MAQIGDVPRSPARPRIPFLIIVPFTIHLSSMQVPELTRLSTYLGECNSHFESFSFMHAQ
jgi:hypothetical protein